MQNNNIPIEKLLANLQIKTLNEMQLASLKANDESDNVILLSSTGSGKTLAFLLPIIQLLTKESKKVNRPISTPRLNTLLCVHLMPIT